MRAYICTVSTFQHWAPGWRGTYRTTAYTAPIRVRGCTGHSNEVRL